MSVGRFVPTGCGCRRLTHIELRPRGSVTGQGVQRQDLRGGKVEGLLKHHLLNHRARTLLRLCTTVHRRSTKH
ncbi:hypothetical protein EYF80_039621 [Liparis tanakae]|uniref:Uncharacterized protein n=1 Tax=Liparis tanakae TaxID=230148 RepID=A0A4Z2G9I0_9TELE|nr:hypothetical protein EYF80_039621 [Liparis tanakae]